MRTDIEIDENLAHRLDALKKQPTRDPGKAAQARMAYLDQAQGLAASSSPAVTAVKKGRHIGWMHPLQQLFDIQKKEHSPMFSTLGTILLIASFLVGGSGATVAAAQSSLPGQSLYPVKTWSEAVRTSLTSDTQTRIELALAYANRRAEEMRVMLRAGEVPPEPVQTRMQAEIDLALRLAAGQSDMEAMRSLEQIRQQLQLHEQEFEGLGPGASAQAAALLDQTRTMLQTRLQLCTEGIQDPELLRQQLRDRDRLHDGTGSTTVQPSNEAGNPWTTGTPVPGSGYGPGPGDGSGGNNAWKTGTPAPIAGYGPGDGDDGQGGNHPWTTGTPVPGSGYGPGPGGDAGDPGDGGGDSGNPQDGGKTGGGDGQGSGPTDGGSTGGGNPDTGGGDSGSGGGTGSTGGGSGGQGGKP